MIIGKKNINNRINMTEMTITKNERKLMLLLKVNNSLQFDTVKNKISREIFDSSAFTLNDKKYVDASFNEQNKCVYVTISQKGKAYLQENPKARNQFFTKKRMWFIGIGITIILGVLAIILK